MMRRRLLTSSLAGLLLCIFGCASSVHTIAEQYHLETYAENVFFGPYIVKVNAERFPHPIDDGEFLHLLPALKRINPYQLEFQGCQITDVVANKITEVRDVEILGIQGTKLTNFGIALVMRVPMLKTLTASADQLTVQQATILMRNFPKVRVVRTVYDVEDARWNSVGVEQGDNN